jgi:hypothetical protein
MAQKFHSKKQHFSGKKARAKLRETLDADARLLAEESFARPGRKRHSCSPNVSASGRKPNADEPDRTDPVARLPGAIEHQSASTDAELDRSTGARPGMVRSFTDLPKLLAKPEPKPFNQRVFDFIFGRRW